MTACQLVYFLLIRRKKHLLPLGLSLTDDGLIHWLKRRIIPKNRAFVHNILQAMGLSINDVKGIIKNLRADTLSFSYRDEWRNVI